MGRSGVLLRWRRRVRLYEFVYLESAIFNFNNFNVEDLTLSSQHRGGEAEEKQSLDHIICLVSAHISAIVFFYRCGIVLSCVLDYSPSVWF